MNTKQIIESLGMSARPAFYSGRPAGDFTAPKLVMIYKIIKKEKGKESAQAFQTMIKKIPNLSGTAFIESLYNLERNSWKYEDNILVRDNISLDGSLGSSMLSIASVSHLKDYTTQDIKKDFLKTYLK